MQHSSGIAKWVESPTLNIGKSNDEITVSAGKNTLSLELTDERTKVTLKIDKDRHYKLIANEDEPDKLNVYRPVIFIRHTQTANIFHNPETIEKLWNRKLPLIAIDFGNKPNKNPENAEGHEKNALEILNECCDIGAIVCAEYSYSDKNKPIRKIIIGKIRKDQNINPATLRGKVYLFCWDDAKHQKRHLQKVLANEFDNIKWLKGKVKVEPNDKTSIRVYHGRYNELLLERNDKKSKVSLKIDGSPYPKLTVKEEGDENDKKLNVYGDVINRTVELCKKYKTIKTDDFKYMLLTAIRPQRSTCGRYNPRSSKIVKAIFKGGDLPDNVDSLPPEQLEVICYEWLKNNNLLNALLLPIGGHMPDVDISGTYKRKQYVYAQVTHSKDANKIGEKLVDLKCHGGKNSVLFFFGPEDAFKSEETRKGFKKNHNNIQLQFYSKDDFKSKNGPKLKNKHKRIHLIPTEWVFDQFKGKRMINEMLLSK